MKRAFGIIFMVIGISLVLGAVGLFVYNQQEEARAEKTTEEYLPRVVELINTNKNHETSKPETDISQSVSEDLTEESVDEDIHHQSGEVVGDMLVADIDGYKFVGYISIPKYNLELPVMSETDMELMSVAPCRFSGSPKTNNLVIGAHNYRVHFGSITGLSQGDRVYFTDIEGEVWAYSVAFSEVLGPNEADSLKNSEYPLTLYTCNYNGEARVTVRCERLE